MNKIKMMVGQQGPSISRVPGQELVIGVDIGAEEAQRLVYGHLAAEVRKISLPDQPASSTLAIAASTVATAAVEPAPATETAPATEPEPAAETKPVIESEPAAETTPVAETATATEPAPAPAKRARAKKTVAQG